MRVWLTLVRRELAGFFVSWTGYTVIAVVAFLFGLSFSILLRQMNLSEADWPRRSSPCAASRTRSSPARSRR
jgi:hypothetical protein